MDPISIALGLAQFAPAIAKWVTGSDKAADAATAVIDIAKQVTGSTEPDQALRSIQADPELAIRFKEAVMASESDLDKAYLQDRQNARQRDVDMRKLGYVNHRADMMIAFDVIGLVSCLIVLSLFRDKMPGEVVGLLSSIAGIFGICLRDAHQFEFGSSRGSKEKDIIRQQ